MNELLFNKMKGQQTMKLKTLKENLIPLSYMLLIPMFHLFYVLLNNPNRGVHSLVLDIDSVTPFIKVFILPYISWYFFIFFTLCYFCIKDRSGYFKTLKSYLIGLIVCYSVYFVYQTIVPRPELAGDDLLTKIVSYIYSSDPPYNAFPSIHVFTTYLMMKALRSSPIKNKSNSLIINGIGILIILSTLFVKQHVFLDVISAIFLGDVVLRLVSHFEKEKVLLWKKKPDLVTMKNKLEI
jgi:membrane-associated phospholipid phosphatase